MIKGFEEHTKLSKRGEACKQKFLSKIVNNKESNPVLSKKVEGYFDISGSEVRQIVLYLRRCGYPIASCSKGYFWAESPEQLAPTIHHLEQRKSSIAYTLSKMRDANFAKDQMQLFK